MGCDSTVLVDIQKEPAPLSNAGPDQSLNCIETQLTLAGVGDTGPEYQITWNTSDGNIISGQNTLTPIINAPGEYCLTVERTATGCSTTDCVTVFAKPQLTINLPALFCVGDLTEQYTVSTDYLQPPYTLNWSVNGAVQAPLVATQLPISWDVPASHAIDFSAWMDFGNGCESDTFSQFIDIANALTDIEVLLDGCNADSLVATLTGNYTAPPQFLWNDGSTSTSLDVTGIGTYTVTITDANGCTWQAMEEVPSLYDAFCAVVSGQVKEDLNLNCLLEPNENGLAGWLVVAEGEHDFYATTAADGTYSLPVFPGDYTLKLSPPNVLWEICSNDLPVSIPNSGITIEQDFLAKEKVLCPKLTVDISTAIMRRCMLNTYVVKYCNEGTGDAAGTYIEVQMDEWATYTSSSVPGSHKGNNRWRFDLGDVPVGECGTFTINFALNCGAQLGESICGKAEIFPHDDCLPPPPNWSGGSVDVEVLCTDSVRFVITNKGTAPTSVPPNFVVIEDAVMYKFGELAILQPGESLQLTAPANGSTWWVEVSQEPNHPQPSQPIAFSEGCGTNQNGGTSKGFIPLMPLGDPEPWQDEDCIVATGSFDPNDKQGFPLGTESAHFIKKNTALEYLIRFQNTGSDTAFTVVVRDTLVPSLDLTALRPGASSHPYEYEVYGEGILQFTFKDIMLPDSNVNEPGSHGFISFEIPLKEGLAPLSSIENKAGIYFDFNEPVITNTTLHTIEKPKVYATEDLVLCKGEEWKGWTFGTDTFVVRTFQLSGYDSFLLSNIHILPTYEPILKVLTCPGEAFLWNGQQYQAPGEYTLNFTASNGCDSTAHLHLQTYPITTTQIEQTICEGDFTVYNGDTLRVAGNYEFAFQSTHGCDSIIMVELVVWPRYETGQIVEICDGTSYQFHGLEIEHPGTYIAQLTSGHGCDSTIILQLHTVSSFDVHLPATICEGESYPFDGQLLATAGTYTASFEGTGGCDSLVTLDLTVIPNSHSSVSVGICPNDTLDFFGQMLNVPGNYSHTFISNNGCDSTIFLNLFFLPLSYAHEEVNICEGGQYFFEGDTLTSTGYYEHLYQGFNGCDSIISLQLNVQDTFLSDFYLDVVKGTILNGVVIENDTLFMNTYMAFNGCDSLVITHVTVLLDNTTEYTEKLSFGVYPNPASNYFTIEFIGNSSVTTEVSVLDVLGRTKFRQTMPLLPILKQSINVQTEGWSTGAYVVRTSTEKGVLSKVIMIDSAN